MDYSEYEVSDFVADEYFVLWVLNPDEENEAFWDGWMNTFPDRRKTIHEARLMVLLMDSRQLQLEKGSKQRIWNAIRMEAFHPPVSIEDNKSVPVPEARTSRRLYLWSRLAALLLIFAGFSYLILMILHDAASEQIVVENPRGEKSTIYLPDGTKVWLNAESKISYPPNFNKSDERLVQLTGEAFFDVTENPIKPFVVKTSDLQIRVLGTAFNVRSFEEDKTVETTLLRGAVMIELDAKLKSRGEPMVLHENQQAIYSSDSKVLSLSDVEAERVASWTKGRLILVNKPVSEIRKELERWYGVEIRMEDGEKADCRFSTTIENEPITRILDLFSTTSDVTYTIADNIITIKGELCP